MIKAGEQAPYFCLPAVVGGERREVGLVDHLEGSVVVLGFYPGDFNPACDGQSTGLDELDLFTMQRDVAVLGISGDSVHSHCAFVAEYDLHVSLLADVHGEVAEAYGVGADSPGYLTRRAVVVVDPEGVVRHAWAADALEDLPEIDRVRAAVNEVGGGGSTAGGADTAAAQRFTRSAGNDAGGADGECPNEGDPGDGAGDPEGEQIAETELAEIAAELEEQSRDAGGEVDSVFDRREGGGLKDDRPGDDRPEGGGLKDDRTGGDGPAGDADVVAGEVELDLGDAAGTDTAAGARTADEEGRADDRREDDERGAGDEHRAEDERDGQAGGGGSP